MEIYKLSDSQKPDEHVDVKVDGLMLKVEGSPFYFSISALYKLGGKTPDWSLQHPFFFFPSYCFPIQRAKFPLNGHQGKILSGFNS